MVDPDPVQTYSFGSSSIWVYSVHIDLSVQKMVNTIMVASVLD